LLAATSCRLWNRRHDRTLAQSRHFGDLPLGWGRLPACGGLAGRQRAVARTPFVAASHEPFTYPANPSLFFGFVLGDEFLEQGADADQPAQQELERLLADGGILLAIEIQ